MSAAAAAVTPRKVPNGWFKVPNSIAENMALLTDAELRLVFVLMQQNALDKPVPVTEQKWQDWTGLKDRMRYHASRGLVEKGLMTAEGRGEKQRFRFDRESWENFVRSNPRQVEKAHTPKPAKPRAVAAKPDMPVHPECRSGGCAMLGACQSNLKLLESSPVSQSITNSTPAAPAKLALVPPPSAAPPQTKLTPAVASQDLQSVTNLQDDPARTWPQAFAVLLSIFPWISGVFMLQLVAACRAAGLLGLRDAELAAAIRHAYHRKQRKQKAEGLFLLTVPESLAMLRSLPPPPKSPEVIDGAQNNIHHVAAALRANRMGELAKRVEALGPQLDAFNNGAELGRVEAESERLQDEIVTAAAAKLTEVQAAIVEELSTREVGRYTEPMTDAKRRECLRIARHRNTLMALDIPGLRLY